MAAPVIGPAKGVFIRSVTPLDEPDFYVCDVARGQTSRAKSWYFRLYHHDKPCGHVRLVARGYNAGRYEAYLWNSGVHINGRFATQPQALDFLVANARFVKD